METLKSFIVLMITELCYIHKKLTSIKTQKRVKGRPCKWLNSNIKRNMNTRDKQLRKARQSRKVSDWAADKQLRNKCNGEIKKAKGTYHQELLNENVSNPRKSWKTIKSIFPSKTTKVVSMLEDKNVRKSIVESFSNRFSSVVRILKSKAMPLIDFTWRYIKQLSPRTNKIFVLDYISKVSIEKQLRSLKRQKATGIDELPPGLLKDCAKFISKPLCHI